MNLYNHSCAEWSILNFPFCLESSRKRESFYATEHIFPIVLAKINRNLIPSIITAPIHRRCYQFLTLWYFHKHSLPHKNKNMENWNWWITSLSLLKLFRASLNALLWHLLSLDVLQGFFRCSSVTFHEQRNNNNSVLFQKPTNCKRNPISWNMADLIN